MTADRPCALIADDEPLLRDSLERLQLIFGDAAQLRLMSALPRGVAVEVEMPVQT